MINQLSDEIKTEFFEKMGPVFDELVKEYPILENYTFSVFSKKLNNIFYSIAEFLEKEVE